jgi:hypothetical protein
MDKEHLRDRFQNRAHDDPQRVFEDLDKEAARLQSPDHQNGYQDRRREELKGLAEEERFLQQDRHERTRTRFTWLSERAQQYKIDGPKAPDPEYLWKKATKDILDHDQATMDMKRQEARERLGSYLDHAAREEGITLDRGKQRAQERLHDTFQRRAGT